MCSKCPPWALTHAQRWRRHWWLQQVNGPVFSIRLTVCLSVSVLQDVIKIKRFRWGVRVLHRLRWKCNCSCVLSRRRNESSSFYKISSALNKITLKIIWLFCGHSVQLYMSGTILFFEQVWKYWSTSRAGKMWEATILGETRGGHVPVRYG